MAKEKNNKKEEVGKIKEESKKEVVGPGSSKKQTLLILTSVIVIIVLTGLIVLYAKKGPAKEGEEATTSKFFKEFAKKEELSEEKPADYISHNLFNFNNEEELNFFDEEAEDVTHAIKAVFTTEKEINGTPVLALGININQGKYQTGNWEVLKKHGDLSQYVCAEAGVPQCGKLKFYIWFEKELIFQKPISILIGSDVSHWVKYDLDESLLKDSEWSEVSLNLTNPVEKGEDANWTDIKWSRILVYPDKSKEQNTTVYLEDIEITNER